MRRREAGIFLGLLMLFSTLAFVIISNTSHAPATQPQQPQRVFVGTWRGMEVYAGTAPGTNVTVYYLVIGRGMALPLRANPMEADKVPVNFDPEEVYALAATSSRIYYLFDPEYKSALSLPYAYLGAFLPRGSSIFYGVSKPYVEDNHTLPYHNPYNVSEGEFSIYLTLANTTQLYLNDTTLVVEAPNMTEMLKATTKLGLILLHILR